MTSQGYALEEVAEQNYRGTGFTVEATGDKNGPPKRSGSPPHATNGWLQPHADVDRAGPVGALGIGTDGPPTPREAAPSSPAGSPGSSPPRSEEVTPSANDRRAQGPSQEAPQIGSRAAATGRPQQSKRRRRCPPGYAVRVSASVSGWPPARSSAICSSANERDESRASRVVGASASRPSRERARRQGLRLGRSLP